jgi:acyl dehydratase
MEETYLDGPPALARVLARGAAGSLRKRAPAGGARLPAERLVLAAARIDPARLARYAEVCGFAHTDPLPVTYPHVLGFPLTMRLMAARDFPFPLLGLVHTGVEVVQQRPLRPGDRPEIRVHTEDARAHRRGTAFDVVTEARLAGEEVWRSRSTYLCRHRTAEPRDGRPEPEGRRHVPLPAVASWELPGDLGRRYAAVSGDRNPLHLHALTARAFGFPRALAHGMWSFARCLAERTDDGSPFTASAEFTAPVLLPGTVTYAAEGDAFALRGAANGGRTHLIGRAASSASPPSGSADPPSRSS